MIIKKKIVNLFLHLVLWLQCFFLQFNEIIYIFGFSHEKKHYYDKSKGCNHHSYDVEQEIFQKLINEGKIAVLTENFDPNAVYPETI